MTSRQWPSDEELDALFTAASHTKSQALRFDPEVPGGFRVLTPEEDQQLIDSFRLPEQRYAEDREHLLQERADAERVGDLDGAETADAHLEVLAAERRLAERNTPQTGSPDRGEPTEIESGDVMSERFYGTHVSPTESEQQQESRHEFEQAGRNLAEAEVDDEERER